MKNINWFNLDEVGNIVVNNIITYLPSRPAIYAYKIKWNYKELYYIGSTFDLARRFRQHRYRAKLCFENNEYNTLFYNYIKTYGWENFQFGVLEYKNYYDNNKWFENKKLLIESEQKYLNYYSPELNMRQIKKPLLEFKSKPETNILSKSINNKKLSIKPGLKTETIIKLKLHNKNIIVNVYNKENNIVASFNRIKVAANFVGLSPSTVSGYIKNGKLWKNLYYFKLIANTKLDENSFHFPLNENEINNNINIKKKIIKKNKSYVLKVLLNDQIIYSFNSVTQASLYLNISKITITKYALENKLWNNKYKFLINTYKQAEGILKSCKFKSCCLYNDTIIVQVFINTMLLTNR